MTKSNDVTCPKCYSSDLRKYGFDEYDNQKYQCKKCKRQFAPASLPKQGRRSLAPADYKYQPCPKCGKATFLHHDYKYYRNLRCWDTENCNHSFSVPKYKEIKPLPQEISLPGKFSFKRMRHSPHLILMALYHYYHLHASTRKISQFLESFYNVEVSHVAIASWVKKFAPLFQIKSNKFIPNSLNESDEWHVDETVVKIQGQKYYIWVMIDSETRYILDFHLSPYRSSEPAFELFNSVRDEFGQPNSIVSDRYSSYNVSAKLIFDEAEHIKVESFQDDITNNVIESFFGTFKDWYNGRKGFKTYESALQLITVYIFFYNFIRPHSALNDLTPAQVAGSEYPDQLRQSWFVAA